jgi:hypothetical protein
MYYSLAQIIVLGRGDDEGWMNILVLVVIAAVYGLGALIRAKGKKAEEQAPEQETSKPQRKPPAGGSRGGILEQIFREIQQAAEGKPTREPPPSDQTTRQQTAHPQAAVRKYAAEAKQVRQSQPISRPAKPKLSKPTPQVQPDFEILPELDTDIQALPEFKSKAAVGLPGKRKAMPAEVIESMHLSEVLADYEDPEELKRAILHYEILGSPLALRDPSKVIIGLS